MIVDKNLEVKAATELTGCTFKPQLNREKNTKTAEMINRGGIRNSNVYNKNVNWKKQKQEKYTNIITSK